jgi:hypothetical protein
MTMPGAVGRPNTSTSDLNREGRTQLGHDRQIRSLVLYVDLVGSRRIWAAQVGWVVEPDGSRRIVLMIIGMIKGHPTANRMAGRPGRASCARGNRGPREQ